MIVGQPGGGFCVSVVTGERNELSRIERIAAEGEREREREKERRRRERKVAKNGEPNE